VEGFGKVPSSRSKKGGKRDLLNARYLSWFPRWMKLGKVFGSKGGVEEKESLRNKSADGEKKKEAECGS